MKTKDFLLTIVGKYKVIKYNFINHIKITRYTWKLSLAKRIISDERYYFSRMERALEDMVYWKNHEKKMSTLDFEREFCKKMVDMHFKRFMYYKQKMD